METKNQKKGKGMFWTVVILILALAGMIILSVVDMVQLGKKNQKIAERDTIISQQKLKIADRTDRMDSTIMANKDLSRLIKRKDTIIDKKDSTIQSLEGKIRSQYKKNSLLGQDLNNAQVTIDSQRETIKKKNREIQELEIDFSLLEEQMEDRIWKYELVNDSLQRAKFFLRELQLQSEETVEAVQKNLPTFPFGWPKNRFLRKKVEVTLNSPMQMNLITGETWTVYSDKIEER